MPGYQLLLEDRKRCFDLLDLRGEHLQHLARKTWQTSVLLIADDSNQLAYIARHCRGLPDLARRPRRANKAGAAPH